MKHNVTAGQYIGNISNQIRRRLDSFSTKSVRGAQGKILHFLLAQKEDVFQKDVEEEFNLRPSSATGILKLLEKNGFIERKSTSYDARLKKIIVTEKAKEFKEQVVHDIDEMEESLVKGIDSEKLDVFFEVMDQISKNLSDYDSR